MKIGTEFNQEDWEKKFDVLEDKYRPVFEQVLKAVLAGAVLGLALLYFGVSLAAAADLPDSAVEYGETWIKWSWSFINATVHIDGVEVMTDNDLGYYLLSDLNANENHVIAVYDLDNDTFYHHQDTTSGYMSLSEIFLIIGFIIGCLCLGLIVPWFPFVSFILATSLLMYLIENNFEGGLILFVGFLWIACLVFGSERLSKAYGKIWRKTKRK